MRDVGGHCLSISKLQWCNKCNTIPMQRLKLIHVSNVVPGGNYLSLPNLNEFLSIVHMNFILVKQSFHNFAQSTTVSLPCHVQNCKMFELLGNSLSKREFSRFCPHTHLHSSCCICRRFGGFFVCRRANDRSWFTSTGQLRPTKT